MHRWRYVPIVVLLFQLVCVQSHATEEEQGQIDRKSPDCPELSQALEGKTLRVHTQNQGEIEGRLVQCLNDTVYVANDSAKYAVSFDAVRALWVQGTRIKRGLITGGIIGGVVGAALGALAYGIAEATCEYECEGKPGALGGAVIGAGLFAIPGALIGTGIGAISYRWNLWYASEAHSPDFSSQYRLYYPDDPYRGTSRLRLRLCCLPETKAIGLGVTIAF